MDYNKTEMLDCDRAFDEIGNFGLWHVWVYFWIFLLEGLAANSILCIIFMQDIPDFICENLLIEQASNWTFNEVRTISTPKHEDGKKFDGCKLYIRNYTDYINKTFNEVQKLISNDSEASDCPAESYDWHLTGMQQSAVTQWNLVCNKSAYVSHMTTSYMIGFFIGCFVASILADRYGRRLVLICAGIAWAVIGLVDPFIPNFLAFLIVRVFLGLSLSIIVPTLYVLALELCSDSIRKVIGAIYFVSWSIGYTALAGVACLSKDWRYMSLIVSIPVFIIPAYFWLIPESPRWLVSQRREKEARQILENAAKWNKRKISPETFFLSDFKKSSLTQDQRAAAQNTTDPATEASNTNFLLVFTEWHLALRTINIMFNWIANAFVYYGISLLITSFSGNIFINNAISGALEAPAYLLCYPLLWWARKKSLMICLLTSGVACLLYLAVPEHVTWAQLLVAFIGKLAITSAFNLIFIVTLELYPTSIRGAAVAVGEMVSRLGTIIAPYTVLIAQRNKALINIVMTIFGVVGLAAGILTFFIPESQNQPLPETLDDAIHYPPKRKNNKNDLKDDNVFVIRL